MIKGFIFDLDGVITDTAEYHYLAWKALGEKIGIPFSREFNEELKGISRMESLEKILQLKNKATSYSDLEKEALAKEKNDFYLTLVDSITPNDLLPNVLPFLQSIRKENMKIGLASASKNGPAILARLGITDYFDTIVDPATLENGKPAPEIFIRAAQQLGLSPEECIGVEDAYAGVEAINAANMFSVGIGEKETLKQANLVLAKTDELQLATILPLACK